MIDVADLLQDHGQYLKLELMTEDENLKRKIQDGIISICYLKILLTYRRFCLMI